MLKKFVKNFNEVINESTEKPHKGEPAEEFLVDLQAIIGLCPNLMTIHYPGDIHGHSSHTAQIISDRPGIIKEIGPEKAFEKISDDLTEISEFYNEHYKDDDKREVTFYIWNVEGKGLKYGEISKILAETGQSKGTQDIPTKALHQLLEEKTEIAEKVTHISISLDSHGSREFGSAMSNGEFGKLD